MIRKNAAAHPRPAEAMRIELVCDGFKLSDVSVSVISL